MFDLNEVSGSKRLRTLKNHGSLCQEDQHYEFEGTFRQFLAENVKPINWNHSYTVVQSPEWSKRDIVDLIQEY